MSARCACGGEIHFAFQSLGCVDCGDGLCPSCAIPLESATYCRRCASALLETPPVANGNGFELC